MVALKVNADYELELFESRKRSPIINNALEFLVFFLSKEPIWSTQSYSNEYLDYIEDVTGHRPVLVKSGSYRNWWGPLNNLEHERWMNSKLTSTKLSIDQGWSDRYFILTGPDDLKKLEVNQELLLKDAFGMSGIGLRVIKMKEDLDSIKKFPCILEPFLNRRYDFSHYNFADGRVVAYQNLVDHKFQYRGTIFNNHFEPSLQHLEFYHLFGETDWKELSKAIQIISDHYCQRPLQTGFSIDSFVHEDSGTFKLHYLCEVNYRRTMGSAAYELAQKYAPLNRWCLFTLAKILNPDFEKLVSKLKSLPAVMLLSPPEVRYQMFLIQGPNAQEGKRIFKELRSLLPECQFPINIED
jgi:hypothetical protein